MKNFFEGLGKSRDKRDISGRSSPVDPKQSQPDKFNNDEKTEKKEKTPLTPTKTTEETSIQTKPKDKSGKTDIVDVKSKEIAKVEEKKQDIQVPSTEVFTKSTDKMDGNAETSKEKPSGSLRLLDRMNQGPTDQNNQKSASSTLTNLLTSSMQTTKSSSSSVPTPVSTETKQSDKIKKPETNDKSEYKEKQEKTKEETKVVQPKLVESRSNDNADQKNENISTSQRPSSTKTQEVLNTDIDSVQTVKSQDKGPTEAQNKINNNVVKPTSQILVGDTGSSKPKSEEQVSKPTVSQPTTNYLVPSNIPQPDTQLKLGRNGVIEQSQGVPFKPYQPKYNSPHLSLTSDKGINRSIINQTEHQKYNEIQRTNEKNLDPCRPTLFSAIDLKHSGFANAEDIERCWNKLGVPDVENLLNFLGFPKHGMINLDHLTQALHEALEMHTYDEPNVLAGIRSMNLELHLTEALKNAYEKEIEKLGMNLTEEREMILSYFQQQLSEIRQKMDILLGQKEVEIKQIQQKLDKTIQSSHDTEIKNKEIESILQTEDKFLNFITNISDIMEAEIRQCEMGKESFNHFFTFNEKIKKTVDQVKSQTENGNHFQRLKDSIQILKDYSQLLQNIMSSYHTSKDQLAMRQYQNDLEETIRKQAKQIRQLKNTASKYRPDDPVWTEIIATKDQ
ncbi:FAM44A [Schistosoma japonicum]|nr:FAM44A [Schistosoma japonicum]